MFPLFVIVPLSYRNEHDSILIFFLVPPSARRRGLYQLVDVVAIGHLPSAGGNRPVGGGWLGTDSGGGGSRLFSHHHRRLFPTASVVPAVWTPAGAAEVTSMLSLAASVSRWPPSHWRRLAPRRRRLWWVPPRPSPPPPPRRHRLRRVGRLHFGGRGRGDQLVAVGRLRRACAPAPSASVGSARTAAVAGAARSVATSADRYIRGRPCCHARRLRVGPQRRRDGHVASRPGVRLDHHRRGGAGWWDGGGGGGSLRHVRRPCSATSENRASVVAADTLSHWPLVA